MRTVRPTLPHGQYLVLGLGNAGQAAVDALIAIFGAECVHAWDGKTVGEARIVARRLRRRGVDVQLGGDGLDALDSIGPSATVVKSPGIDFDIPVLQAAAARGLEVFDELELGWRIAKRPIVGVTGTNGKSTTAKLIAAVLKGTGEPAHLVGNTEFGPPLSMAPADGWTVCEVSSFQLEASPSFLPDIAVFTNLTPEHLTRHLTMESYGAAKRSMFVREQRTAGAAILNCDDSHGRRIARDVTAQGGRVLTYGFAADADVQVEHADWDVREARLVLRTPVGAIECTTRLPGAHNAANAAAAFAVGHALGLPGEQIARALADVTSPPGRWEVISESESFDVIVDYAHTPDGIRQLLQAARAVVETREGAALRTVFGAVSTRDSEKARASGQVARELSDHLILTTGSAPRDPRILRLDELRKAATSGGTLETVLERPAAIERAIELAQPGDVVVVLGLGRLQRIVLECGRDGLAERRPPGGARDAGPHGVLGMELILATHKLADPGGAPTYTLTVAEQLARLGHSITLYTRELGAVAELARERALRVTAHAEDLPVEVDAVISGVDRSLTLELAARYLRATRLFIVHGSEEIHLPPPVSGAVAATIVLNDLHAARAASCVGAGEVVRLRQPVDLRRFSPSGVPGDRPTRVLLLGNYHRSTAGRADVLREAWADAQLDWREIGGVTQTLDVPQEIARADIVVGYGRSMLETMACGRLAYVHDHSGSEGWITPESYERMEAGGFAVAAVRPPPSLDQLRSDIEAYRSDWGRAGHDLARAYHDARDHATEIVTLIERLQPGKVDAPTSMLRSVELLAESQLRAELMAEHYRIESKQWFGELQGLQERIARERGARHDARTALESERDGAQRAAAETHERLLAFKRTRRYRLTQALVRPLDMLRRRNQS